MPVAFHTRLRCAAATHPPRLCTRLPMTDPWAAVVCGSLAGCLYPVTSAVLAAAGVDDPLDACAVHLGNGVLGILLVAIVAKPAHVAALTGSSCGGVLYSSDGWLQLGVQAMGAHLMRASNTCCCCCCCYCCRCISSTSIPSSRRCTLLHHVACKH
jgi:ammonia channel protein AmtB